MLKVTKGCVVRISYELKFSGGEVLESSQRTGPLDYVHGEEKKGVIPAKEIFGDESSYPVEKMKRSSFPADAKLEVGAMFSAKRSAGQAVQLKITEATTEEVTVRVIPELSGKDLEFSVKVLVIDDPAAKKREGVAPPPPPAAALNVVEDPEPDKK